MQAETFVKVLGADFYTGAPDSQLKALCNYLMNTYGIDPKHHVIGANEGNCAALAAGYHLATGKVPVVSAFPGYTDTAVIAGTTGNCNCLSYGPGTLAMAHKADEYVDEADIRRCQKVYETLLKEWLWM